MDGGVLVSPPATEPKSLTQPGSDALTFDYAHGANKVPRRQVTEDDSSQCVN